MLLNKVIRVRDKVPQHQHHHRQSSSSSNSTAELSSISPTRGVSTPENTYINVPELILSGSSEHDDPDIEIDRLALINSSSSRSSSVLAKGFSDTDSGISNAGSSSCESFQSEHYLPDPGKDVLYDDTLIPGTDGIVDFDDDDFTFKLNLSLANLGIGPYGEHIGSGSSANIMLENANMGLAQNNLLVGGAGSSTICSGGVGGPFHYSPHFDFNLDELGVDFDIVEPPPAFANSGGEEEKCQLVVDSEAEDPNEIVDSVESHNLTENDVIECSTTGTLEEEVESLVDEENEEEDDSNVSSLAKLADVNNSGTCDSLDRSTSLAADVSLQNNVNLSLPMEHVGIGRKGVEVGNLRKVTRREVQASGSSHSHHHHHHHHHQHIAHSCTNRNSSSSNISNGTSGNRSCINGNAGGGGSALSSSPTTSLLIPTPPASSSSTSSASSSSSVPIARRIINKQKAGETSGSSGNTGPSAASPSSSSSSSGKKRKRERYEIRIGYLCYELPINTDKHVSIYSLQKNKDMMEDLLGHSKLKNSFDPQRNRNHMNMKNTHDANKSNRPEEPNPSLPICTNPTSDMTRAGRILRTLILTRSPGLVRDRRQQSRTFRRCLVGAEMVDWLLAIGSASGIVKSRHQATGMWQALLEEGIIQHVTLEYPFRDKYIFYRFTIDAESELQSRSWSRGLPSPDDEREADLKCPEVLAYLAQRAPDAIMRLILRKPSYERTTDDLEMIYEELLHIKALAHLSNSVKRELAGVIVFEAHPTNGTILFHQGDEGKSWYIILKGSVNVVIRGKGAVTSLFEGDDFGKLALVNDAPRAATIVCREDNCHFLRVDKDDFNRILRDVEANTVRLKEHGQDVLVLEKISANNSNPYSHFKYTVMAGSPAKMLEHLLETRLDGRDRSSVDATGRRSSAAGDTDSFLEEFLMTHIIFMPIHQLLTELQRQYPFHTKTTNGDGGSGSNATSPTSATNPTTIDATCQDREFLLACKRRVVQFVHRWITTIGDPVFDEQCTHTFLDELFKEIQEESSASGALRDEVNLMLQVMELKRQYNEETTAAAGQKWKLPPSGQPVSLFGNPSSNEETTENKERRCCMRPPDDIIFRVYCADHTYCTLRFPLNTSAESLKHVAADKLGLKHDDLILVELKSSGEKVVFHDSDVSIPTSLSLNGRIFISLKDHLDALTCLPEQERPTEGLPTDLEMFSTRELAYHMTVLDWSLFKCVHEYELIYRVFGRHHFRKITSNLDVFLRRFNEIQFWVATEILMTSNLSKRVALFRKFLKLAAYCKEYQNLNAFFAIVMGLGNTALSRLTQTWERLPSKSRKVFAEFESFIDPSRNHRAYRMALNKMSPPVIPFMPLILKDMTFTHEGNKTYTDGLVSFEKMHMLAQTIRIMKHARSRPLSKYVPPPTPRNEQEVKAYIRCLRCIDNQRVLNQLSQKLEPKRIS